MKRILLTLFAVALVVVPAASASTVVYGTVGPGYTITLRNAAGKTVRSLPHGVVVFKIRDRSSNHDFHLTGKGVDRATEVAQSGAFTWHLTLKPGRYTYKCDPHQIIMIGHFTVV